MDPEFHWLDEKAFCITPAFCIAILHSLGDILLSYDIHMMCLAILFIEELRYKSKFNLSKIKIWLHKKLYFLLKAKRNLFSYLLYTYENIIFLILVTPEIIDLGNQPVYFFVRFITF